MAPIRSDRTFAAVLEAEQARTQAMVEGDLPALEVLLHADLRYVHSTGAVDTKNGYLTKVAAGVFSYQRIEIGDTHYVDLGGAVVLSCTQWGRLTAGGRARDYRSRAVAVWSGGSAAPRLMFFQATPLPLDD
jgi:hypothetical protein